MIGLRLSKKDGGRLEISGLFYLVYAVIYLLFWLGSLNLYQLSQFSAITQLYAPVLLALSIGFICRHVGKRIVS